MKKTGFARRGLAMLLSLIMVLQMVPVIGSRASDDDIASGEDAGDMGIYPSTLNQEGSINWPVKIYDYLNDGMLFEYANVLTQDISSSTTSEVAGGAGYGGGEKVPVTSLGTDYTHPAAYSENAYLNHEAEERGTAYTLTPMAAVPFVSPRYLQVTAGSGDNMNIEVSNFIEDNEEYYAPSDIRYMTIVYRAKGLSDNTFRLLMQDSSYTYYQGEAMDSFADSSTWVYRVVDLRAALGTSRYDSTTGINGLWVRVEGLSGSDVFDISHVAYFDTAAEAANYGKCASAFSNNPGEDLSVTVTTGGSTMPNVAKPDNLFALRTYYKTSGATSGDSIATDGNYGLDFTTTGTANGYYANGYNSDTYSTWASGTTLSLPYGSASNTTSYTMSSMGVSRKTEVNGASYVRLTSSSSSMFLLSKFREESGNSDAPEASDVNYLVMVLRGNNLSSNRMAFWAQGHNGSSYYYAGVSSASGWASSAYTKSVYFTETNGTWTYLVVPLDSTIGAADSDMYNITYLKRLGIYLPSLSGGSLDLAYVGYFNTSAKATAFGQNAAAYMNSGLSTGGTTLSDRGWNAGNNQNFGMLYASCGGYWGEFDYYGNRSNTTAGGYNSDPNGYYSWMIGYHTGYGPSNVYNTNRQDIYGNKYTAQHTDSSEITQSGVTGTGSAGGSNYSNHIYFIYPGWSDDGIAGNVEKDIYDTSVLPFDGYSLLQKASSGLFTAGLLEGTLSADRTPVYRQETVEYIAMTLYNALPIPQKDANGNYNYNFVKGATTSQYGGVDLNGDGKIGMADLNHDGYNETDEAKPDLATALRYCLGIQFIAGNNRGTAPELGSYSDTAAKASSLKGEFNKVRGSITTCMDAAYYLLNNIFVDNSYNQLQNDYGYMTLSGATLKRDGEEAGFAYVFDAGFTTGMQGDEATSGYADKSQSALVYSPYEKNENGTMVHGSGMIYLENVNSKDLYYYQGSNATTRFPFLPITDAEGDYAGESSSYYFCDDGIRCYEDEYGTYQGRNFNYVLASNGEFVYREEDKLFFEFEGDDDVYLFINGQIVLDIGGGHSIASVGITVDDYVQAAREATAELAKYGYTAEMSNAAFDKMIDAATLTEYTYDSNGNVTSQKTVTNPYSEAQKTMLKRHHRLNLLEGEICQFDFYYMERHGNGANMRIVTNMHVTDPTLTVEKTAYQYEDDIEYGGVVDAASPVEYNFKLSNTGNTKLYNLTFTDGTIGVTLDPTNGLTVAEGMNGLYVLDKDGGPLDPQDVYAVVRGTNSNGVYSETTVHFQNMQELKNFLHCLDGEGLESGYDDAEITNAGSGLWVDASVEMKGIYYILTPEQVEEGLIHNTVYVTGTTRMDPNANGSQTLRSDASHRAYTSGAPVYYQWAGHDLQLPEQKLLDNATDEAGVEDSLLNQYYAFFNKVGNDTSKIYSRFADKYGRPKTYDELSYFTDGAGNGGFKVNYAETGTHNFYVLMFLNSLYDIDTPIEDMTIGNYAIVRVTIYTANVEDSYYVLDYGLKTESLDMGGELFKNDYLFGTSGGMSAKLMGVTITSPTYLSAAEMKVKGMTHTDYNRIGFDAADLTLNKKLTPYAADNDPDGYFNVNLAIPSLGKDITYDSYTGQYSLTGPGTVTVNAEVPIDSNWEKVCLYYWYDNGTNNGWPGTPMNKTSVPGKFQLDIPGDVSHIIINNGSTALQTQNLTITAGVESTVKISVNDNKVSASVQSVIKATNAHVSVPDDWGTAYLYYKFDDGTSDLAWPGIEMTERDENGYYIAEIPGNASYVTINNGLGNLKQTNDLDTNAGQEVWLTVNTEPTGDPGDGGISYYKADIVYSQDRYTVKAQVPADWGNDVFLYYWYTGSTSNPIDWPGVKMTKKDGWYTVDISDGISNVVITNGTNQTVDLTLHAGLEAQIQVNSETIQVEGSQRNTAIVTYGADSAETGLTFTPTKFMDGEQSLWLAITVHTTGKRPTALGAAPMNNSEGFTTAATYGLDINNEVQMFKKVTVLPANVVYYEDDFKGITYNLTGSSNSFLHHGDGSVVVNQSVDQEMNYGQDPAYQSGSNTQYSGSSMTAVQVRSTDKVASFTFKGTGFELISRTNATNSASIVIKVYKEATFNQGGDPERVIPVVTQFDNGNNGGSEEIWQVPAIRVKDLELGKYVVEISGTPTYDFSNWDGSSVPAMIPTYLYIDGLRIYQPMGATHSAYLPTENGASFEELRDLVSQGVVGVAGMNGDELTLSAGTTTWTENLRGENSTSFEGNQVDSTDAYLIKGPNNEVYMQGGNVNAGMVMYVQENAMFSNHELQVAIRALDYKKFHGAGSSGMYAQLQVGVRTDAGYGWQTLTTVVSGTEQYYSIPYTLCPKDSEGRYQIVLRVVGQKSSEAAMVSYSSVKLVGMDLLEMEGIGEASILHYVNGLLVAPGYAIFGNINGVQVDSSASINEYIFNADHKLDITFTKESTIAVKRFLGDVSVLYMVNGGNSNATSVTMVNAAAITGTAGYLKVPAGHTLTLKIRQSDNNQLELSYELKHSWDAGQITTAATCTTDGEMLYTCSNCGGTKTEIIPATGHSYVNGKCSVCGAQDPDSIPRVIYFRNTAGWAEPHIYTWTDSVEYTGTWPGKKMTRLGTSDLYFYTVPAGAANCIFNDGTDANKTGDLTILPDSDLFIFADNRWISYDPNCIHATHSVNGYCDGCGISVNHTYSNGVCTVCGKADAAFVGYYLVGYINGADYGCEGDYENTGIYKFVDGKLVATFTQDSYVFMKTGDNSKWFMFQTYTTDTTGTLYDTTKGTSEKMFVPGGVEITFTLVVNADESLTLSYTVNDDSTGYVKVDSESDITSGGSFVLVAPVDGGYKALGTTLTSNKITGVDVTVSGNTVIGANLPVWTIEQWGDGLTLSVDGSYLKYASSTNFGMTADAYAWTVAKGENGFVFDSASATRGIYYRIAGDCFGAYANSNANNSGYVSQLLVFKYNSASANVLNLYSIRRQMLAGVVVNDTENPVEKPTVTLEHPTLSFEDEIRYNVYYSVSDMTNVVEMGLITFDTKLSSGTIADATSVIKGYITDGELYMSSTKGVAAKNMGDNVYFKAYALLADGSYVYSDVAGYNAVVYANTVLNGNDEAAKALVLAMLDYGAEAQKYFDYKTAALMNKGFGGEAVYEDGMLADVGSVDSAKLGSFAATAGAFTSSYPKVSFEGAFAINYYFTPAEAVDNGVTLYYWDSAAYADAQELTAENATGTVKMTAGTEYWGSVTGIAAKQIDETIYVAAVYTSNGQTCCSGVIAYSLGRYLETVASDATSDAQFLAQTAAIYGTCAKDYFG